MPTDFVLRATLRCVAAHVIPSLTLRVDTFFCYMHAQVKHSYFAASFCTRARQPFHSALRAQIDPCPACARRHHRVVVVTLGDMSHGISCSPTQTSRVWNAMVIDMSARTVCARFRLPRCIGSTVWPATASMLGRAHKGGHGPAPSARRWCSGRHARGRHHPWSSLIFCCATVRSSRHRPSRTSCARQRRRAATKGGRFSTIRAVRCRAHQASSAWVGHPSPPPPTGTRQWSPPTQWSARAA